MHIYIPRVDLSKFRHVYEVEDLKYPRANRLPVFKNLSLSDLSEYETEIIFVHDRNSNDLYVVSVKELLQLYPYITHKLPSVSGITKNKKKLALAGGAAAASLGLAYALGRRSRSRSRSK